jgi:hypothetical protein
MAKQQLIPTHTLVPYNNRGTKGKLVYYKGVAIGFIYHQELGDWNVEPYHGDIGWGFIDTKDEAIATVFDSWFEHTGEDA